MTDDEILTEVLEQELRNMDAASEVVIANSTSIAAAKRLTAAALSVVPNTGLSHSELVGIGQLIYWATSDRKFLEHSMSTHCGFSHDEFQEIARKLPTG